MVDALEVWQISQAPHLEDRFFEINDVNIDQALALRKDINRDQQQLLLDRYKDSFMTDEGAIEHIVLENLLANPFVSGKILSELYELSTAQWREYILENALASAMDYEMLAKLLKEDVSTLVENVHRSPVRQLLKTSSLDQIRKLMENEDVSLPQLGAYIEIITMDDGDRRISAEAIRKEEDLMLDILTYVVSRDINYKYLEVDVAIRMRSYFKIEQALGKKK